MAISNKPWHKAMGFKKQIKTRFEVGTTGWSSSQGQSGTTLYMKQIPLNHVYDIDSITVDIGQPNTVVLPTATQQTNYNLLQYVTVDNSVPCLYLFGSAIPAASYYISVTNVD